MTLTLKIILGSTRPTRKGPAVAKWIDGLARKNDAFKVELVDLAEIGLPLLDEPHHPAMKKYEHEHTKRWSAAIEDADALIFVTPEYDFFAPASLVNAIQCLSQEWKYKVAGVVCYGGISGGLRSSQELRMLLVNNGVMPIQQVVPLPMFADSINEDGVFVANDKMIEGAEGMLSELVKWGTALKTLR